MLASSESTALGTAEGGRHILSPTELLAKAVQTGEWRRERPDWRSHQAVDGSHVHAALIVVILRQDDRARNSGTNGVIQGISSVMVTNSMEQHPSSPALTVSAVCVHLD